MTTEQLTIKEFNALLDGTRIRADAKSVKAAKLVLVNGKTAYAAATEIGIGHSAVSLILKRLRFEAKYQKHKHCPTCRCHHRFKVS